MEFSKRELQIMKVLWHSDMPLTSSVIKSRSTPEVRRLYSINKVLSQLLEKRAVEEHGFVKDGRHIARTFVPTLSQKEYFDDYFAKQDPEDMPIMLSALLGNVDETCIRSLREVFLAWEKSKQNGKF